MPTPAFVQSDVWASCVCPRTINWDNSVYLEGREKIIVNNNGSKGFIKACIRKLRFLGHFLPEYLEYPFQYDQYYQNTINKLLAKNYKSDEKWQIS